MIQTSSILNPAGLFRGDHQAAASALPVILSGDDAGHRTTTGHPVGSPGPRRSLVPFKPAISVKVLSMSGFAQKGAAEALMEFTVSEGSGPPAGIYKAEFLGVVKTTHEQYGDGARFDFKVIGGEHAGKIASRTCKPTPSPKNVTGKLMAALLGGAMKPGEKVSLAGCIGKTFTIVVGLAANGETTRVESVVAA